MARRRARAGGRRAPRRPSASLARLRREHGLTQVELAERLGVAQPIVSDYERGELRLHGQLIVRLTAILGVSADELLGLAPTPPARPVAHRRLVRRLQAIDRLPRRDPQALYRTIDAFLKSATLRMAPDGRSRSHMTHSRGPYERTTCQRGRSR